MSIIIFLVILLVLIVSHEFGHFIVAKKSGIRVDEFSFGFPPKLFGFRKGETNYNFNLLPLGGYVKIFGENGEEIEKAKSEDENGNKLDNNSNRSFANKPAYIKAMVLFGGVAMNFLVAWLLFSVSFMSGLPSSTSSVDDGMVVNNQALTITSVLKNSPAYKSGIKAGDKILSLETTTDSTKLLSSNFDATAVQTFIKSHNGEDVKISLLRNDKPLDIIVIPEKSETGGDAKIGISMDILGTIKLPIHKAIWEGLKLSGNVFIGTVVGFYNLIHSALIGQGDMSSLTGPVGIVGIVGDAANFGFIYLLSFTALISINLAVINLIPFPALDGGRLLFLLIEKIKGSPIKSKVATWTNTIGFSLLMLLMVIITYHDIVKLL